MLDALMLKCSTLDWSAAARSGETVEVDVDALSLGRSSLVLRFTIRAAGRPCPTVARTVARVVKVAELQVFRR